MIEIQITRTLTLATARRLADAAMTEAEARGLRVHISVVDAAGSLLAYLRIPGAPLPAREFSERKAITAVCYSRPTSAWKDRLAANPHLATGLSQHPHITMIAGGRPILVDGETVGAIGIAGGLEGEDDAIAQAALARVDATD